MSTRLWSGEAACPPRSDAPAHLDTLLTLHGGWVPSEGEFLVQVGKGCPCILDTGSHSLVLDGTGAVADQAHREELVYGSETVWCKPAPVALTTNSGTTTALAHLVVQRSRRRRDHGPVGILGLAWASVPPVSPRDMGLRFFSKNSTALGLGHWQRTAVSQRPVVFRDGIWGALPTAEHLVVDARRFVGRRCVVQVHWMTPDQQLRWSSSVPVRRDTWKRVPLQYYTHMLSDGRALQFLGWRENDCNVLFETGSTRSAPRSIIETDPRVDLVLGNVDMLGRCYWFDLAQNWVWISPPPSVRDVASPPVSNIVGWV